MQFRLDTFSSVLSSGDVIEQQDDDFWDYDKQADLEGFSSKTVYDTLAKQSRDVTQTIGKQKDEVSCFKDIFCIGRQLIQIGHCLSSI